MMNQAEHLLTSTPEKHQRMQTVDFRMTLLIFLSLRKVGKVPVSPHGSHSTFPEFAASYKACEELGNRKYQLTCWL